LELLISLPFVEQSANKKFFKEMRMRNFLKSCLLVFLFQLVFNGLTSAQLVSLPRGGNKRATVSEEIGITNVMIQYSRPGVKKRDGHIWGELIPTGYSQLGYGAKNPTPWRAGANENTTIEFTTDVKVDGHDLPAGKYGFFVAYGAEECTLIFSKNSTSWGNFFYDSTEDALRVKVKPVKTDRSVEWLKYEFADQTPDAATIQLQWEKLVIPFTIKVDVIKHNSLRSEKNCAVTNPCPDSGNHGTRPRRIVSLIIQTWSKHYYGRIVQPV